MRAIAVHGRTRADFYEGEAEYETMREVCATATIPVIANGDIDSAMKAREVLDFTRRERSNARSRRTWFAMDFP